LSHYSGRKGQYGQQSNDNFGDLIAHFNCPLFYAAKAAWTCQRAKAPDVHDFRAKNARLPLDN